MAKLFLIAAVLSACCAVLVKGLDKNDAIEELVAIMEDCKEEAEAQDSDIEEIFQMQAATTMEGKCMRACIMKAYEFMDDDGKLDKNAMLEHLEEFDDVAEAKMNAAAEIVDKCGAIGVPEDHCEAADEYGTCFREEAIAYDLYEEFKF